MKRKFLSVLVALVLACSLGLVTAVPVAAQATYYVATDGSDTFGDGTETWVDNDTSGDWSSGDTGPWLTIQHAIDTVAAGNTISVAAGTYEESIVVNKADLTLESASGRDLTTIQNVGNAGGEQTGFLLMAGATNFTLGGSEGHGFTIEGGTGTAPRLFQLNNAPSGVEVSYNAFDTSDTAGTISTGINIGAAGATGLTVSNNIFVADEDATYQDWPLIGGGTLPILDVTVTGNEFTGSGTPDKYGAAIALKIVSGTSTFSGNIISAFDRGIVISAGSSDLDVSGNSISNCGKGVLFRPGTHAEMENNTFANNTYNIYHAAEIVTGGSDFYGSIQDAIDNASPGDTILVYDGTYQESISVTTDNLTLRSENGMDSTTIENVGNVTEPEAAQCGFLIRGPASNFTLGGAADQGFTFSGGTSPRLIQLNNAPSGVEISHNTVNTTGTASTGILIGAAGATGLTVSNNIFIADEDACQDWPLIASSLSGSVLDVTVTANEFTGSGTPEKYGAAIDLENVSGVSTFSGNIISAFDRGIIVDGTTSGLDVSGNSISNCGKGVLFRPGTHAEMVNNTFADNTYNIYHAAEIVTGGSDFYGNIQDAIDPADPGDTILVYAGLYEESISIDKSLTVQSEEGAVDEEGEVVTELHGYVDIVLGVVGGNAAAETVVFDGFYMEEQDYFVGLVSDNGSDATISNNVLDTCYVGIWLHDVDNGSSVTVSNNTIMYYGCGIMSGAPTTDNASSVTIEGNKIFYGEVGICFDAVAGGSELTIRDNVVAENDCGIAFYDVDESTVTIAGNTIGEWYSEEWGEYFYGNHSCGIYFSGPTTVSGSTITIGGDTRAEGNVISDNGWVSAPWYGGIRVEYLEASDLEILNNDILYNHYGGVEIWDFDEDSTVDIHYNSIVGNDAYGVSYDSPYLIDATCNWWGDVAGPSRYTNPCYWTSGDYVSSSVDYIPWLIQSDLAEDWNIWSAPIAPDAASWAQMQAELVEDGIVDIYYYDSATQYWGADADDAGPLDAYYIKMPAESRIRYCINDEATFPGQKDMKIGWNFIGLADLHPGMGLESALLDVYYGTGVAEGLWGLSKVISPSLNPESWTYQRGGTPHPLFTTKGYWVFMVNDGVLGGFTETPIVEVEGDGGP